MKKKERREIYALMILMLLSSGLYFYIECSAAKPSRSEGLEIYANKKTAFMLDKAFLTNDKFKEKRLINNSGL